MVDIRFKIRNHHRSKTYITIRIKNFVKTYKVPQSKELAIFKITFRIIGEVNQIDYIVFGKGYYKVNPSMTEYYGLRNEYKGTKYIYDGIDKDDKEKHKWGRLNFLYEFLFRRDIRVIRF